MSNLEVIFCVQNVATIIYRQVNICARKNRTSAQFVVVAKTREYGSRFFVSAKLRRARL